LLDHSTGKRIRGSANAGRQINLASGGIAALAEGASRIRNFSPARIALTLASLKALAFRLRATARFLISGAGLDGLRQPESRSIAATAALRCACSPASSPGRIFRQR
jgi:hypothetical protein